MADRYMRHASAAYGPQFLHLLGLAQHHTFHLPRTTFHPNHHAFAEHTGIGVEDVLLSSFTPTTEAPDGVVHALVHYVSYDRAQKAVVLTLRGTMGLSDVLTDLCWDYATLRVGDVDYSVHAGMLEGARRLSDPQGEVVRTVRRALEAEPTYGLILTGHSLGAGVAALLAVMWSQELSGTTLSEGTGSSDTVGLPTGRRIRCVGFGVPCVMDAELGERCASLITTIVHGDDVVPSLSLGIVRDFKNVAISLSEEKTVVEDIVRRCIGWERSKNPSSSASFPSASFPKPSGPEEADWFWSLIKTMRADMTAEKLCPPGQVYMRIRDTTRIRMVLVRDIRSRFGEVIFGRRMFTDHSPKYYEDALRALSQGARVPRQAV
ncbi:Alpha/Beta hydrolase protein [Piptocephalis cylindrospora]|uniref:sn-1-specific diacylglycerol lipase n=1 Tax=Piptocephalis cylindrospora TaxID=1907219 RepID=A0A4P9Y0L6_9FUNG|nr:Alpha/Beta hydrolase protein [Piptocephalis cylindrospora]|eukprot:RKP11571.1 Alpha/Beta hydrolase protein [Piptocephalis cylindrospora]